MSCEWVGVCAYCGQEVSANHLCEEMAMSVLGGVEITAVRATPVVQGVRCAGAHHEMTAAERIARVKALVKERR